MSWGYAIAAAIGIAMAERQRRENKKIAQANQRSMDEANRINSLDYRVEAARRLGIPVEVAVGGGSGYQPSFVNTGDEYQAMGQDLSRAIYASQDSYERKATEENLNLRNELIRAQIARLNSSPVPPQPSGNVVGDSGLTKLVPSEAISASPGNPSLQAGAVTDYGYAKSPNGGLAIIPSQDIKERIEDQFVPETAWVIRNTHWNPPRYPGKEYDALLPKGARGWDWNPFIQEWEPRFTIAPWEKLGQDKYK